MLCPPQAPVETKLLKMNGPATQVDGESKLQTGLQVSRGQRATVDVTDAAVRHETDPDTRIVAVLCIHHLLSPDFLQVPAIPLCHDSTMATLSQDKA